MPIDAPELMVGGHVVVEAELLALWCEPRFA